MGSDAASRNAKIDAGLKQAADEGDVPGVVAMATDRKSTIYEGAFGKRVLGQPAAMTPDTVGWIASMTKAVTSAAVMQLVEQGKLDLDADVNKYLTDFKLPTPFGVPVTLRNLMTHTAGLEDGAVGYLFKASPEGLVPLDQFLREHIPAQVRPPTTDFNSGANASYSNWGTVLAGRLVEIASGQQFDDYINSNEPIGRTLDFLAQEMNREINTIGSKANDSAISREVVVLKTELEKFREQVQNVE